jgi:hypothetical protein
VNWMLSMVALALLLRLAVKGWTRRKVRPLPERRGSAKVESRTSIIKCVGADTVSIENSFLLGWIERGSTQNAVVIQFRTGELYSKEGRVCLNAMLTYKDGPTEIANILGHWRETKSADGYSEGDCKRTLIAGMSADEEFIAYEGIHMKGGVDTSPVAHVLKGFVACTLSIRVIDRFNPRFVYEGEFILTKEPLSIVPKDECTPDSTEV